MNWCSIDEKYLDFLRNDESGDSRIPYSEYFSKDGKKLFKPFFTPLFTVLDLVYITQISSPKTRHYNMKNSMDFIKIFKKPEDRLHPNDTLYGVINLNFMFPVPKEYITNVNYKDIEMYKDFTNATEKSKYIDLLDKQLKIINTYDIQKKARKLYDLKNIAPGNVISRRCLDFKALEILSEKFKIENSAEENSKDDKS